MSYTVVAIAAYIIGAVPFPYLIVRLLTGLDIRQMGTGNVGVMNTVRHAGLPAGLIVFVAEGLKGVSAVGIGRSVTGGDEGMLLAAFMALVGANWSVFVGFAGGRGTTVSLFMLVLISWQAFLILAALWFTLFGLRRNNFLATRAVILAMPVVALLLKPGDWAYVACALGMSSVLLLRHRKETDDHLIASSEQIPTT